MDLDSEHILFWMDAIRNSKDPKRTLESFWKGQIRSKEWLINSLRPHITKMISVDICGGWNGVLASMLFQSNIICKSIRSIDIDPNCEEIANTINKMEQMVGKFQAVTADMCDLTYNADVVINTSCEHITQEQYDKWLGNILPGALIVIQSNNYEIPEHIRTVDSLKTFEEQSNLKILWSGEYKLPLYKRFMIVGKIKDQ
jgi:hypothetical protein